MSFQITIQADERQLTVRNFQYETQFRISPNFEDPYRLKGTNRILQYNYY